MKTKLYLLLISFMISSCAGLTHVTLPETTTNYANQDIETTRKVSYTLPKTYVFGIGGLSKKARNTNIMDKLMENAQLQPNEALSYITYSQNTNCYAGIVTKVKISATGYVIKSSPNAKDVESSHQESNILTNHEVTTNPTNLQANENQNMFSSFEEPKFKKEHKPFNKPKGYFGIVEAGYGFEFTAWNNVLNANFINGYRISPYIGIGVGVGLIGAIENWDFSMPIFIHLRSDFLNRSTTPFISINCGYNLQLKNSNSFFNGLFAEPTIGLGMKAGNKCRFNIGIGATLGTMSYKYLDYLLVEKYNNYYEVRETGQGKELGIHPNIKLGLEF